MHFTKVVAILSIALTATALPTVEDVVIKQRTANTGTAQSCAIQGSYQACCQSTQTTSSKNLLDQVPSLGGILGLVFSLLLPVDIKTATTCNAILAGNSQSCEQAPKCCFNGPTTQNNAASLISLFSNNNVVFCPDFFLPVNVPLV